MSDTIESLLRHDRRLVLAALLLVIVMAWSWLLAGAGMGMSAADMTRMVYGDHSVMKAGMMTAADWGPAYWALMFSMWWVMMIAMMLPSATPTILLAAAINRRSEPSARPYGSVNRFALGYLLTWGGFSALATVAQWALESADLVSSMTMSTNSRWLVVGLLLAAALWQFTALKQACLRHCRSPVDFLVNNRHLGPLRMGLWHGAWCLGCCWFLMLLLFVGGVMNLFWIGGLAIVVLLEKLLPAGRAMGLILGAVLAGWAALLATGLL